MNAPERAKHFANIIDLLLQGASLESIKTNLRHQKVSNSIIKEIALEVEQHFQAKYGSRIRKHLIENDPYLLKNDFSDINLNYFETLKKTQLSYIEYDTAVTVKAGVINKIKEQEIIDNIGFSSFSESEL